MRRPASRGRARARIAIAAAPAIILLAVLGAGAAVPPPPRPAPADPEMATLLERFDAAQTGLRTVSAHFKEVKTIGLLKDSVVQSGEFFHTKPDKVLWEYTSPETKLLMLNGKSIIAYYPKQKRAEEIRTRFSKRMVKYLGLGSVLKDLQDECDITLSRDNRIAGTDLLVLVPKGRQVAKRLKEVRIWVDREISLPRVLEYVEADGDRTLISFDNILVNPEISLTKYEIKLPDDVTVTNGLSGFFGGNGR